MAGSNRFGVFVDAGYVYAASGMLLFGSRDRRKLILDFESFHRSLLDLAHSSCGFQHLRTYWYDGARDAVPTPQQRQVANLPGLKLRLGRLTPTGQKGVDSRIVRDLIILSVERGITTAFLLAGDEDLREGVSEAQERGVRVVVLGIEPLDEPNMSPTLVMEADEVIVLGSESVSPHFQLRSPETIDVAEPADPHNPYELGRAFAVAWRERVEAAEYEAVRTQRSVGVPPELDRQLLSYVSKSLSVGKIDDIHRREMRRGFWDGVAITPDAAADPPPKEVE